MGTALSTGTSPVCTPEIPRSRKADTGFKRKRTATGSPPIFHIIQPCGNQARVRQAYLHSLLELSFVPRLPLFRRDLRRQHLSTNPFVQQKLLQAARYIALAGIDGEHLDVPSAGELLLDFLNQPPLFGVDEVLV